MTPSINRPPATVPIVAWHDQDLIGKITIYNRPPNLPAVPQDLTGQSAVLSVFSGDTLIESFSSLSGEITLGGVAGTIEILVPAATINAIPIGTYQYRLNTTGGPGPRRRLIGSFTVAP